MKRCTGGETSVRMTSEKATKQNLELLTAYIIRAMCATHRNFSCPGQRNWQRLVPVPVTGVRYNSLFRMCTLNTLTWPDLTTGTQHATDQQSEGRKEMFYLTTHSTHFIYSYMASNMERTTQIAREERKPTAIT